MSRSRKGKGSGRSNTGEEQPSSPSSSQEQQSTDTSAGTDRPQYPAPIEVYETREEDQSLPEMPENVTEMGRAEFNDSGLLFSGRYTFDQWRALGSHLRGMRDNTFWWLGDWWIHGERAYGEMASQEAQDEVEVQTGYTYNTVRTAAYVCERFPFADRLSGISFKHHQVVAPIESKEKRAELLAEAREKKWTVRELEDAARPHKASSRSEKRDAGLFDDDAFVVGYADFPWKFENTTTPSRKAEKEYPTMTALEGCALKDSSGRPVQDIFAKSAVLFFWIVSSKLEEAMQIINAWGFEYQTNLVWDKGRPGLGHYGRQQHEILAIATRGTPGTPKPKDRPPSVLTVASLRKWLGLKTGPQDAKLKHSEKPAEFRKMIERMYPKGARIELFARERAQGWSAWGNEAPAAEKRGKRKRSAA